MNESKKTGRCEHQTGWIENHQELDRRYMPKNQDVCGVGSAHTVKATRPRCSSMSEENRRLVAEEQVDFEN